MFTRKFDKGLFKFRMPNVFEGLKLEPRLKKCMRDFINKSIEEGKKEGIENPDLDEALMTNTLVAEGIECLEGLISEIKIKKKEATFLELCSYEPAFDALKMASDDLVAKLIIPEEKKSGSRRTSS